MTALVERENYVIYIVRLPFGKFGLCSVREFLGPSRASLGMLAASDDVGHEWRVD